ncbi:MAG TPA: tetratricopeptide repeat protein [Allosphingosinicella sp.]|nr:tetratricopeptide repeat protein [Allosphingosinicella sp.]
MRETLAAETETIERQRDLLRSYDRMGNIYAGDHNLDESQIWFEKALDLARRLIERNPSSALAKEDLLITMSSYTKTLNDAGLRGRSVALAREALATAKELANQDSSPRWLRRLAIHHSYLADALKTSGSAEEVRDELGASLDIFRRLAALNQGSADAQRDYSIALERMAEITAEAGDESGAIGLYRQSLAIARKLAEAHPENTQLQRDLAITESSLAKLEDSLGGTGG